MKKMIMKKMIMKKMIVVLGVVGGMALAVLVYLMRKRRVRGRP